MSNCNCKKDKNGVEINETNIDKKGVSKTTLGLLLIPKIFLFIIGAVLAAIIVIPFSIYLIFKVIFLDERLDVTDGLLNIGKYIKKKSEKKDEDDEDEYEFEDEDELVLLDAE